MTAALKETKMSTPVCLFNIIFYVESSQSVEDYQQFLDLLKKRFPCRSIFVIEEANSRELEVIGDKPITPCDPVIIKCSPSAKDRVSFLVLTYLLADLPIYVIWSQDLVRENPVLFQLRKIAKKIVFDPFITTNLKEYARQLLKNIEFQKCGITDFAWFNCFGWRELFAATFNTKARIDDLFHARIVRIKYNACLDVENGRYEIPAIYFQAWLSAQMNWKIRDVEAIEGNIRVCYERFLQDTVILLVPEACQKTGAGTITSVEIEAVNQVHFLFKKRGSDPVVTVWISKAESCEIPFDIALSEPSKEQLVINELFGQGTNHHYHNMLRLLYQTQWND